MDRLGVQNRGLTAAEVTLALPLSTNDVKFLNMLGIRADV